MTKIATALLVIAACGASEKVSGSGERYTNAEQGYSLEPPDGWQASSDRGAIRFAAAASKQSITVRAAVRLDRIDGRVLTNDALVADTLRTLQALPHAHVTSKAALEGAGLPGETFTVTYEAALTHQVYRRTHVVLIGRGHVIHVIAISPAAEAFDEALLKDVITSLREEG